MDTKQRFVELVKLLLANADSGYHFWLRYKDKYITGEGAAESNGDTYAVLYLIDAVDDLGYPNGDVIRDAYIDYSTLHKAEAIYEYLTEGKLEEENERRL